MNLLQVDAGNSDVASCDQPATYVVSDFYFLVICCMFTKNLVLFLLCCMECRHGRSSDENSVRLFICKTSALWQNGRTICPNFYTIQKSINPSFLRRRMVGGCNHFYLEFWVNRALLERNCQTLSEKSSVNTNRKSTTRFPMSLRWSSYVAPKPPKRGSKTQNGRFASKIALRLKKVCY